MLMDTKKRVGLYGRITDLVYTYGCASINKIYGAFPDVPRHIIRRGLWYLVRKGIIARRGRGIYCVPET